MRTQIYLDYNATQPLKPVVRDAMLAALQRPGNPSSIHGTGRQARLIVEEARLDVAALIGTVFVRGIIFTAGATEANATALNGVGARRVLVSAIEHPSVLRAVAKPDVIPVSEDGVINLDALKVLLEQSAEPTLVSVMMVNNETGVIQPVAEAAAIAHAHGALFHCDATQAPGRLQIDVGMLGVDLLTLSAHKIGGPQGAGALYVRPGLDLMPLLRGGGQEERRRAGTENVAALVGFGVAARLAGDDLANMPRLTALRNDMESRLAALGGVTIYGAASPRVGNTTCFGAKGLPAETALMALDIAGIAVSSGAACSSGAVEPSPVLLAMGHSEAKAREAIRVSLGWGTTPDDIDHLVESWSIVYRRARAA
jgi:cysteine desulfurase